MAASLGGSVAQADWLMSVLFRPLGNNICRGESEITRDWIIYQSLLKYLVGNRPKAHVNKPPTLTRRLTGWALFHQMLDEALQDWDANPPTAATRANSLLTAAIQPLQKALRRLSALGALSALDSIFHFPEVEDAVTLRRQAQKALKVDPDDDVKATAYQEAAAAAQTTINNVKTKLRRECISNSHGDFTSAEVSCHRLEITSIGSVLSHNIK